MLILFAVAAVVGAAAAHAVGGTPAQRIEQRIEAYRLSGHAPTLVLRAGQAPAGFTGGPITAADGETVGIYVEDPLLTEDPNAQQRWANVLTGLLHGQEISAFTVYMATFPTVQRICGASALGCYGNGRLVAIGDDFRGVSAQSVLTHEYGHHVANSRRNDPWSGVDWGTKRWASYVNVCARSKSGELAPGDEGANYQLNPGEAFAEDYRVLNERRAGLTESPWEVVDTRFYPDQGALDALSLDITSPWTGDTTTTYTGRFTGGATGRGFRIATQLDGDFNATLTSPRNARLTLRIVDPTTGSVLAVDGSPLRTKTLSVSVCGQRTLQVQVRRVFGGGTFSLAVAKP